MAYLKIGTTDISSYVSGLKVSYQYKYNSATNASGNTVVDYINSKRVIEVEIIPLVDSDMRTILTALAFSVNISYREPQTGALVSNVACIVDQKNIEYYTIQSNKVMYKKMKIKFIEL